MSEYINGTTDILGGSVIRYALNTTTPNQAVIRKIIAGNGISISSTGVDPGTGDVTISIDTSGTGGSGGSGGGGTPTAVGTVTAVNMTAPEGMFITGAPITTAGTISLRLSSGYVVPLYVDVQQGKTAYGWGNHASVGYLTAESDTLATVTARGNITTGNIAVNGKLTIGANNVGLGQRIEAYPGPGNFDFINSSGGGFSFNWIQNGGTAMSITTANNLLVGAASDTGVYRVDVSGKIRTTGAIYPGTYGSILNNCLLTYISNHCGSAGFIGFGFVNTTDPDLSNTVLAIYQAQGDAPVHPLFNFRHIAADSTGNASALNIVSVTTGINQTNGSNGVVRGFYYNPTLTSVNGTHYAWESTSGKIKISDLSGTGDRFVVADSTGVLVTATIGSGLSYSGGVLSATGGAAGTVTGSGTAGRIVKFNSASDIGNSIMTESSSLITVTGSVNATSFVRSGGTSSQFLMADGSVTTSTFLTSGSFVSDYNGAITGLRNSLNKVYTLTNNYQTGTTKVYVNGVRYSPGAGNDYTESAPNQITFTNAPDSGDLILVDYIKS